MNGAPAIAATDVSKRYGDVAALTDVTVAIDGLATGLLGANGAGKSTLMRALLGLVRPDTGTSTSSASTPPATAATSGGASATCRRASACRAIRRRTCSSCTWPSCAACRAGAAVLRASEVLFQVGLEEERSRPIGTFSTGMRQRVKLAQALVHGPELVVLDEPTAGLDPAGREEMLQLVRRLSLDLGVRVLLSSHVLEDVARTCDAVVVLRDGHVVTSGLLDELRGADATAIAVRVTGDVDGFRAALVRRGLTAEESGERLVVQGADSAVLDAVRDAAAESGVGIRELAPAVPTVEDILVGAMEEV